MGRDSNGDVRSRRAVTSGSDTLTNVIYREDRVIMIDFILRKNPEIYRCQTIHINTTPVMGNSLRLILVIENKRIGRRFRTQILQNNHRIVFFYKIIGDDDHTIFLYNEEWFTNDWIELRSKKIDLDNLKPEENLEDKYGCEKLFRKMEEYINSN